MLTGLDVKQAATAQRVRHSTVFRRIRKGLLKANKPGAKWQVYLSGKGCSLCKAAGAVSVLARCARPETYYCASHSLSVCNGGQHGQSRAGADA